MFSLSNAMVSCDSESPLDLAFAVVTCPANFDPLGTSVPSGNLKAPDVSTSRVSPSFSLLESSVFNIFTGKAPCPTAFGTAAGGADGDELCPRDKDAVRSTANPRELLRIMRNHLLTPSDAESSRQSFHIATDFQEVTLRRNLTKERTRPTFRSALFKFAVSGMDQNVILPESCTTRGEESKPRKLPYGLVGTPTMVEICPKPGSPKPLSGLPKFG